MPNTISRRAVKEDCPRLMELVHELAVYEKAPQEVTVTLEHFEESGFGKTLYGGHLLQKTDGVIQGFALYYIRYSTWKGQRMYLEDIMVQKKCEEKGSGKLLFERLLKKQKKKNSTEWCGRCWTGMNPQSTSIKNTMLLLSGMGQLRSQFEQ